MPNPSIMEKIFAQALKVRTLFGVAVFGLVMLYVFKDTIENLALAGDSNNLNLLLAFLFFSIFGVLAVAGFYAIADKETEKGSVSVRGSKGIDTTVRGGGVVDVRDSEDVKTVVDNPGANAADPEKKT